ncbi:MAG: hypothetical protein ACLTKG_00655 [Collinsella intestinalis]
MEHELTHVVGGDPRRSEAHAYLSRPKSGGWAQRSASILGMYEGSDATVSSAMRSFARTLPERYSSAGCQTGCSPVAVERGICAFQRFGQFVFPIPVNLAM